MSLNLNVNENVSMLFERLENFLKSKTVIGEPFKVGDTTMIPIVNVSFGLGSGGGDGADHRGSNGTGGGAGIGAKISPTAIIVVKGENVELLPIKKHGGLEKLIEMVPEIIEKIPKKDSGGKVNESKE